MPVVRPSVGLFFCPFVNAISQEPLNQSTSNLVYDVIPPKGRTLLILGHVRKLRWPPSNFLMYAIDTPCERDIFFRMRLTLSYPE